MSMLLRYRLHLSALIFLVVAAFMAVGCNGGTGASTNLAYPQATILANVGTPITIDISSFGNRGFLYDQSSASLRLEPNQFHWGDLGNTICCFSFGHLHNHSQHLGRQFDG